MTLQLAFKQALTTRALLSKLGYTHDQIKNMKANFKAGKVSIELMRKVVKDAGYICVTEEDWEKK